MDIAMEDSIENEIYYSMHPADELPKEDLVIVDDNWLYDELSLIRENAQSCAAGVLESVYSKIFATLMLVALQRVATRIPHMPRPLLHLTLLFLGCGALRVWIEQPKLMSSVIGVLVSYAFVLQFAQRVSGCLATLAGIMGILYLEFTQDPTQFAACRGVMMIFAMKVSALSYDSCRRTRPTSEKYEILPVVSYLLSPATLVLGPFISYHKFIKEAIEEKQSPQDLLISLIRTSLLLAISAFCLFYSSCGEMLWSSVFHLLPPLPALPSWLPLASVVSLPALFWAYHTAQAFRASHYFISFLSQAFAELSGHYDMSVVRPWKIELPRSITEVVVVWNEPMHKYLYKYVYAHNRIAYGGAVAVLATFIASALLHGLNFQLTAVLLSLGLIAFFENKVRNRLARRLNACVRSRACEQCNHRRGKSHPVTLLVNFVWTCVAIYHLIYLGMVFTAEGGEQGYSWRHTLHIWQAHNFASHAVAAATALLWMVL